MSSLYNKLKVLNIINTTNGNIIVIADEGKDIEKRDVNAKGGDVIRKRNNKQGEKPFINYNS